jgi:RNA polymerase sigma-70 factor (ECF subfamily)
MERSPAFGEQFAVVLEAARSGADWAWGRIYDGLAPSLLGYLRSRGAPDPDGICGDVLCQLVRDIHRFRGDEAGFRSWVFVMAHHRLLDDLRRRKRRPEALTAPEDFGALTDPSDMADDVVRRERERDVRRLIEGLTAPQRDVLLLRIFGGLTVEEVAKAVGRRPGAVKALQRRGLEALRRALEEAPSEYPSEAPGR